MKHRESGFTLIEILIVVSVIGVLASIAVPTLIRSKTSANEGAVIGTLRSVSSAQFQFKAMNLVDTNQDGGYEYGTLGEITGIRYLRGTAEKLAPRLMSNSLGTLDSQGQVFRHGYLLALYLPDAAGKGLPETAGNLTNIDPNLASDYWTFVAWPGDQKTAHTFFVNQQGQILKTRGGYVGTGNVPPAGCALLGVPPDQIDTQELAVSQTGADGNNWLPVQ